MVFSLIIAGIISSFLGDLKDTIAILVIVVLNAVSGVHPEIPGRKGDFSCEITYLAHRQSAVRWPVPAHDLRVKLVR